jgi:hypothetical protein
MIKVGQHGHIRGTMLVRKGLGKIKGDRATIVKPCEKPCGRNRKVLLKSPMKMALSRDTLRGGSSAFST